MFIIPKEIPEWLLILNKNSYLNSNDMRGLFQCGRTCLDGKISPDRSANRMELRFKKKNLWKVSSVIDFINKHNAK